VSCSSDQAALLARKTNIETALSKAWAQFNSLLDDSIDSYSLDDGSGKQSTKRRDPEKLKKLIDQLETDLENVNELIACKGGVVSLSLNRLGGRYY
jgi:hypothetical protein